MLVKVSSVAIVITMTMILAHRLTLVLAAAGCLAAEPTFPPTG